MAEPAASAASAAGSPELADVRRALRRCFAKLGTEPSRLILAYYDFADAGEHGAARQARRERLAARLGLTPTRLRRRALAIRLRLEAEVEAELGRPMAAPLHVAEDAETAEADVVRDAADWRALLLGALDADRAAVCAARSAIGDLLAIEAWLEAETDLLDDHARDRLTVAETAAFEQRLPAVSADLQQRQRFAQAMRPVPGEARRTAPGRTSIRPGSHRSRRMLLAGATIAAAMALTLSMNPQWLAVAPTGPGRPAAVPVRDTAPPTVLLLARGAPDAALAPVKLALSPNARELRVQAEITHADDAGRYRLRVLPVDATDDAAPLFEAADLPLRTAGGFRHVEALVPAPVLLGATRRIRVEAQSPAGAFTERWTVHAPVRTAPDIALPPP